MTERLLFLYLTNLVVLSTAVALFEIVLEKEKGWASGLDGRVWGRKFRFGGAVGWLFEKPYVTLYHLAMFGAVLPGIFFGEYALLLRRGSGLPTGGAWQPFVFFGSLWVAVCVVEDFLWFAMNWHYPRSLSDLFAGGIWWHTRWVRIGTVRLPRFYVWATLLAVVLLGAGMLGNLVQ